MAPTQLAVSYLEETGVRKGIEKSLAHAVHRAMYPIEHLYEVDILVGDRPTRAGQHVIIGG